MDGNNLVGVWMVAEVVAENETVQRTFIDWLLLISGLITALTVIGGAFIWLVWPRAKAKLIHELIDPIQATHRSLTVNGGKSNPPTALDKIHDLGTQVALLSKAVHSSSDRQFDLADKMDLLTVVVQDVRNEARAAKRALEEHEDKGKNYLGLVEVVLQKQGIQLPSADDKEDDE